jgi:flagellar basal-body rod protein FlgF
MDRLIYTAMTGAKHAMEQQANTSNNLANVGTTGFRAQLNSFRAVPVISEGLPTRAFVVDSTVGTDFSTGPIQETGRNLDVAVQGEGWLAVQMDDGSEAYTRNGSLKLSENGILQTQNGATILGESGPISVPPNVTVTIAKDGTVSSIDTTGKASSNILGKLKLVNPTPNTLVRGDDGLFRMNNGETAQSDPNVNVIGGALEGSNVNVVDSMVNMITLAREFEMNMSLLKNAESNAAKAAELLALG